MKCRRCGKGLNEVGGYLERVNAKGQKGVWQCVPSCAATMSQDERLLSAIEGKWRDRPQSQQPKMAARRKTT